MHIIGVAIFRPVFRCMGFRSGLRTGVNCLRTSGLQNLFGYYCCCFLFVVEGLGFAVRCAGVLNLPNQQCQINQR